MATQENFNLNKTSIKSAVVLPNSILIIALVYFAFIVEQDTSTSSYIRKFLYYLFIALDILALIFINLDYLFSSRLKSILTEFVLYLWKIIFRRGNERYQEQSDEIKDLVDKSVQQNIMTQEKNRDANQNYVGNIYSREPAQGYGQPIYTYPMKYERELLTSKAKIDERFISGQLKSPTKSHFDNPQQNIFNKFNQFNMGQGEIELAQSTYSFRLMKSFQLSNKFTEKLKPGNENKDDFLSSIEKLDLYNYERYIENFKFVLSHNLISSILDDHYENIDHLNKFLESSLNVQIVDTMVDEAEYENFYEELSSKMRDTNLSFSTVNVKNLQNNFNPARNPIKPSYSSGFNLLQDSSIPNEKYYLRIFFGDNEKLGFLIDKIEEKLKNIKLQRERTKFVKNKEVNEFKEKGLSSMLFSSKKDIMERPEISYGAKKKKLILNNPLKNQNKFNVMSDYADLVQTHNMSIEENLNSLKDHIELRIELNNKLSPFFVKVENNKHMQILLLKDLKKNNFTNYKNHCGGNFLGENWINAFPTDSQILSSIFIKFMENIYEENDIRQKTFLVNWPLAPKMEKNSNSLIIYQTNQPLLEPNFEVYYEDEVYNCLNGKDNFFFAAVIFLHLMRMRMPNVVGKLKIDDLMASIFKF